MKVITVGRSSDNDIVINDAKVSRTHMQLVQSDNNTWSVVDLNSANGTFVNGQKITSEARLRPHDVIRIGNTILPWQEYFKEPEPTPTTSSATNNSKLRLWGVICAIVIVFAGSVALYFYFHDKEQQSQIKIREYEENEERLRKEAEQLEAKRVQDNKIYEEYHNQLKDERNKNKAAAEANRKDAIEANKRADAEADARRKSEEEKDATVKKVSEDANRKIANIEKDSKEAIQNTKDEAEQAISKANTERDSANERAKLTEKFYDEYAEKWFDKKSAGQVYEQLQYEIPNDPKTALKDLFNASDNKGKQAIVDAILVVKQNSKNKVNEPEVKSDSLKTSKDSEITDNKSAVESDE